MTPSPQPPFPHRGQGGSRWLAAPIALTSLRGYAPWARGRGAMLPCPRYPTKGRAMVDFGIYVNNRAAVFLGEAFSLERLLDAAVAAEDYGLDFVSVGDSILAKPRYMPIPVLAAIAARTRRIKL